MASGNILHHGNTMTYQYSPLQTATSIRLISFDSPSLEGTPLRLRLEEFELSDIADYEALSYTWGDANETVPLHVAGGGLDIIPHLDRFLRRLQEAVGDANMERFFLADQICIIQKDIAERNRQVALMADIYR